MKKPLGILLLLILAAVAYVAWLGRWNEWQFSPETFQLRSRWGYQIPFTEITLFQFTDKPRYEPIVLHWKKKRYLKDLPTKARIWHLGTGTDSHSKRSYSGPAKGFWSKAITSGHWIEWSETHPSLAERIWPMIINCLKATRKGDSYYALYLYANDLLIRLDSGESKRELQQIVDRWQAEVKNMYPNVRLSP